MSTNETKSRFAWIGTAVEAVGFVICCGFIGIGISLACFTAADTVVNTRDNARRVVELGKRLDALEAQARPKVADVTAAEGTALNHRDKQVAQDAQR